MAITLCSTTAAFAQEDELIMTFKSDAYAQNGENNVVSILLGATEAGQYVDIDYGYGKEELELEVAQVDSEGNWSGSFFSCSLNAEGTIKVYGDPTKINLVNASGCFLTEADLSKMTNLTILDLSHNELKKLDLKGLTKLNALYLNDNSFAEEPLVVGNDKPGLIILDIGQVGRLDSSFTLADYPQLLSFDAWNCRGLKTLDPSQCPGIKRISIDSCPVSSLDVSHNPELMILNISETGIVDLDLSNNENLMQLYTDRQSTSLSNARKLTSLDVTHNPNLVYLFASGNDLTSIDISNNIYLTDVYLNNNLLTNIDVSKNRNLRNLMLRHNYFDFNTLPLPQDTWTQYDYMQRNMAVAKSMKVGSTLDLTSRVIKEGYTTTCAVFMTNDANPSAFTQLGSDYYTYDNGKLTFLKETSDSVYVAFACDAYPAFTLQEIPLRTNKFMVKSEENYGKPDLALTLVPTGTANLNMGIGIYGATEAEPKTFFVDYGDGNPVEYTTTTADYPATANVNKQGVTGLVTVYVPENEKVSALSIADVPLTSIDLTALHELDKLSITNAGLTSIDMTWNRRLRELTLTGNQLDTLYVRGANDAFHKTLLQDINLSNNKLTKVTLNDNYTIHNLDLSNNLLTELSFKDADMMETLNLSNNLLTELNLSYCTEMTSLNIANNNIKSLVMPEIYALNTMHCEYNDLQFSTLPQLEGVETYIYAPQNEVSISKKGPGVDLSAYTDNGNTVFVWKKADGTLLKEGTDYNISEGRTYFLSPVIGEMLHCEMTNSRFPELTLATSSIEAGEKPNHVLATFKTTDDCKGKLRLRAYEENTTICIDWKGTGVEYEQYVVGSDLAVFDVVGYKDSEVQVLAYNEDPGVYVFSCDSIRMKHFDASKMPHLLNLTIKNAGLESITLPDDKESLSELNLDNNNLSSIDATAYPNIVYLMLNYNNFSEFDASPYKNLQLLGMGGNKLTSINLDNSSLWSLDLGNNQLEEIDLSKLPELYQLAITYNKLSQLDISMLSSLRVLLIDHNRFRLSTLPAKDNLSFYIYGNQEPVEVTKNGCEINLSSEAYINNTPTTYRWFVEEPYISEETRELTGNDLQVGEDFEVNDGITKFLKPVDYVVGVMTNEQYPDLYLYTTMFNIEDTDISGIDHLFNDGTLVEVNIYTTDGKQVRSVKTDNLYKATNELPAGVYVVKANNKTIKMVKK